MKNTICIYCGFSGQKCDCNFNLRQRLRDIFSKTSGFKWEIERRQLDFFTKRTPGFWDKIAEYFTHE